MFNSGALLVTNATLSGNLAPGSVGSGIDAEGSSRFVSLSNTSVVSNAAIGLGNPAGIRSGVDSTVQLTNTLLVFNTGVNCFADAGAFTSFGNNLSNTADCAALTQTSDKPNTDPVIGPLQWEGNTYVHPLLRNSPAIDAIFGGPCPPRDQRGVTRPQFARCDIGAYEAAPVDLNVDASASAASVILGNAFSFLAAVTNDGSTSASGVVITGTLPADATAISCTASQGTCSTSGGQLVAAFGVLPAGSSANVTLQMQPSTPGIVAMTFYGTANELDTSANNDAQTTEISVEAVADLRIGASAPESVTAGVAFAYTVYITNDGPGVALNPIVTTTLPAGLSFVSESGTDWSCAPSSNHVLCAYQQAQLPLGEAPAIAMALRAAESSQSTFSVEIPSEVRATSADPDVSNNNTNISSTVVDSPKIYTPIIVK
jgi:uncharacterized repeat protein (TIGR01451 family)